MKNRIRLASEGYCKLCGVHKYCTLCVCIATGALFVFVILLSTLALILSDHKQTDKFNKYQKPHEMRGYFEKFVQDINGSPDLKWKAKYNPFGLRPIAFDSSHSQSFISGNETLSDKIIDDIYNFYKTDLMHQHIRELTNFPVDQLPVEFDARQKWPKCSTIHYVPNQGSCGSCYAVAVAGVASDRTCIASNGTMQELFSADDIISCCDGCGDCYGGDPLKAAVYWVNEGLVTGGRDGCRPYPYGIECGVPCSPLEFAKGADRRKCHRQCQNIYYRNDYLSDKHYASIAYSMVPRIMISAKRGTVVIPAILDYLSTGNFNSTTELLSSQQTLDILKKELYLFGPMTMSFPVTEEFFHYDSGIYSPYPEKGFTDRLIYWHVVRLIGWGHDSDGLFYWICVNSFGRHWGENGRFRIDIRFLNKLGLEYEAAVV